MVRVEWICKPFSDALGVTRRRGGWRDLVTHSLYEAIPMESHTVIPRSDTAIRPGLPGKTLVDTANPPWHGWRMTAVPTIPLERIEQRIILVRGQKVMLDADLAALYEVETKALVRQVKRNRNRFPDDFMFDLTHSEWENLKRQFGTSSSHGGRRTLPYVFTEQGVAMLASVLRSERAAEVNIQIVRAFVKLRELITTHKDLAEKIETLESQYDQQFQVVFDAIRKLMEPQAVPSTRRIGFVIHDDDDT